MSDSTAIERYLEDFTVGQTFRTRDRQITAEEIKRFAADFDPQPFHLDEALADRRVIAALKRLRATFPSARVRWLVHASDVSRGPFSTRKASVASLVDEMLTPARSQRTGAVRLGSATSAGPDTSSRPTSVQTPDPAAPILAFYLEVLLAVAALCAIVLDEMPDRQRAA